MTTIKRQVSRIRFSVSMLLIILSGCSIHPKYDMTDASKKHPAAKTFFKYLTAVAKAESFDNVHSFFSADGQERINKALGWNIFVYSSSYNALKGGRCESISVKTLRHKRAQVDCKGPYKYFPSFSEPTNERMHLRVFLNQIGNTWYISSSGFQHTQFNGATHAINKTGLRFTASFN